MPSLVLLYVVTFWTQRKPPAEYPQSPMPRAVELCCFGKKCPGSNIKAKTHYSRGTIIVGGKLVHACRVAQTLVETNQWEGYDTIKAIQHPLHNKENIAIIETRIGNDPPSQYRINFTAELRLNQQQCDRVALKTPRRDQPGGQDCDGPNHVQDSGVALQTPRRDQPSGGQDCDRPSSVKDSGVAPKTADPIVASRAPDCVRLGGVPGRKRKRSRSSSPCPTGLDKVWTWREAQSEK